MFIVLTIHHETDKFLKLQSKYLEKYSSDYKVFCCYSGFTPPEIPNYSFHEVGGSHPERLNKLFDLAVKEYSEEDIVVFMDSDAFPISKEWQKVILEKLVAHPVAGIVRRENGHGLKNCEPEKYTHPCFFTSTFKFFSNNNLRFEEAEMTGYKIGRKLEIAGLGTFPFFRSNAVDLHPLYFGVYGDLIYHHGAGNRLPYDGVDICKRRALGGVEIDCNYPRIPQFNQKLSNLVYQEIVEDDNFILNFLMGVK